MPENRKLSEIQLVNEVFDIKGKSLENQNRAESAISDKYDWVGTIEEYQKQRIVTEHPEWICFITDDVKGGEGGGGAANNGRNSSHEDTVICIKLTPNNITPSIN